MDGGWFTAIAFAVIGGALLWMQVRPPQPKAGAQVPVRTGLPWWLLLVLGLGGGAAYLVGAIRNSHGWWWVVVLGTLIWVTAAVIQKARDDGRDWVTRLPGAR